MGKPISEDEFGDLLRTFSRSADRIEAQPVYAIGEERAEFEAFLAGAPRPPSQVDWWKAYLDDVAALARQGKSVSRIRVIPYSGPTDYQRWLMWADPWYAKAGVSIRYLPRRRAKQIGMPLEHDWELLDDTRLIIMRFTEDGEIGGKELVTDPAAVAPYRTWRDLAVAHAIPAEQYAAA
jgi:hypothetical protein